jgi:hypothetical protein
MGCGYIGISIADTTIGTRWFEKIKQQITHYVPMGSWPRN